VHSSSTVNIHVRAQKGYYLKQACTKCTYKRHIAIKQEVDIHKAGDKAIKNIYVKYGFTHLRTQVRPGPRIMHFFIH
jgi:PHP family Zn ribbon phosphoesterase